MKLMPIFQLEVCVNRMVFTFVYQETVDVEVLQLSLFDILITPVRQKPNMRLASRA